MENELHIVARYTERAPVDLDGIFVDLGLSYRERPIQSGESGWIERDGEQYRIVINSDETEVRRRFTAAHELAHYLLHRDLMDSGGRMYRHTDRLYDSKGVDKASPFKRVHEIQANRLAAQIIMPASLVRQKFGAGVRSAKLAIDFKVSKAAMDIRLKTLGLAS